MRSRRGHFLVEAHRGRAPAQAAAGRCACALFAAPRAVWAQRPQPVRRIGFLSPTTRGPRNEAFVQGMRDLGYVDGRDVIVETRFADGRAERLPALASEMLGLNVEVLVAGSTIGARAAKNATATVPIVFAGSSDPVAGGIVSNLARPQGNITGLSLAFGDAVAGKWLELLSDAVPGVTPVAALRSTSNSGAVRFVQELGAAARSRRASISLSTCAPRERSTLRCRSAARSGV